MLILQCISPNLSPNTIIFSCCLKSVASLPPANEVCEGYVFTRVCLATGGPWYPSMPCRWVSRHALQVSGGVSQHALQVSRPTPKGELEGSGQGRVSRPTPGGAPGPDPGGSPGPHPAGYPSMYWGRTPPPDGYCCGRYASYWNAFLFLFQFTVDKFKFTLEFICLFDWQ